MGRPKKGTTAPAATNGDQPTNSPADVGTAQHATVMMEEFMQRDDRAGYLSLKQAAAHIGIAGKDQVVRNAIKHRDEFKPFDAVIFVKIEGYDMQPLTYVKRDALDLYHQHGRQPARNTRAPGGAKRFIVRLTPDQRAAFEAGTLNTTTIKLETASAPHKKKDAAPAAGDPQQMTIEGAIGGDNNAAPDNGAQPDDSAAPAPVTTATE